MAPGSTFDAELPPRGLAEVKSGEPNRAGRSVPLDTHGNAHAAADAKRGEALFGVLLLHLVKQRNQHARAGSADRMADGDGAAIDIDLADIPAEILVHGERLRGEGLIGLDQVEIANIPAGLLERLAGGGNRARAH